MSDRRGSRFLLEAVFLVGLAAALAFARLRTAEIAGAMLAGWVLVATLEWAAWRGRPHYGSGLPPRYYVPRLNLPAGVPVPGMRAAAAPGAPAQVTAPPAAAPPLPRREAPGDWPFAAPGTGDARRESPAGDPWLVASLPVAPIERGAPGRDQDTVLLPAPAEQVAAVETWSTVAAARAGRGPTALHTLDLLAEPPRRRRGGSVEEIPRVEVPARPPGVRRLPSRWRET